MKERKFWITLSRPNDVSDEQTHQFVNSNDQKDYYVPFNVRTVVPEDVVERLRNCVIGSAKSVKKPDGGGEIVVTDRKRFAFDLEPFEDEPPAQKTREHRA